MVLHQIELLNSVFCSGFSFFVFILDILRIAITSCITSVVVPLHKLYFKLYLLTALFIFFSFMINLLLDQDSQNQQIGLKFNWTNWNQPNKDIFNFLLYRKWNWIYLVICPTPTYGILNELWINHNKFLWWGGNLKIMDLKFKQVHEMRRRLLSSK